MKHHREAWRYAEQVIAGKIVASQLIRKQCQKVCDWRERKDLYFDAAQADKVCAFVESFPHTKGPLAKSGEPLKLEPWQKFFLSMIFGWKYKKSKLRVVRRARLFVARKNGKSDLAARVALYMLTEDDEFAPEVYCGATSEAQAWEVFRPALRMAKKVEDFREHYGVECYARSITSSVDDGFFKPIIGKPGDGASPSCSITDEYHEHADDHQLNTMITGMGARSQPLSLVTSTAGETIGGPCYNEWLDCTAVLNGVSEDDELFALIYAADPDDEWDSDEALLKANPNIGVSVSREFLESQRNQALAVARKQGPFKTKHLNLWVGAMDAFFNIEDWKAQAVPDIDFEAYADCDAWIAADLASKRDIAAVQILVRADDHQVTFGKYFLPEEGDFGVNTEKYDTWTAQGFLTRTPGNVIDFEFIEAEVLALAERFRLKTFGYDPYQGTYLATRLQAQGIEVVQMGQTVKNFSDPMKAVDADITSGKLVHDGNDCMTWQMSNVVHYEDAKSNVFPRKARDENKIDGPVALIMCYAMAGAQEVDEISFWAA